MTCLSCGTPLTVTHVYPPIPIRTSDYSCHCPNCYDGAPDSGEFSRLQGHGATAEEAVDDWVGQAHEMLAPYVCPGCHAVAEACAPGCIDAEREREDRHREEQGQCDYINARFAAPSYADDDDY